MDTTETMTGDLGETARHLISLMHAKTGLTTSSPSEVTRTAMEASRMACLTWALAAFLKQNPDPMTERQNPFFRLSHQGEMSRVDLSDTDSMARQLLTSFRDDELQTEIASLSTTQFIELMSALHSIGSHFFFTKVSSRRVEGAYYTPFMVAEYMAESVIGVALDRFLHTIERHHKWGLEGLAEWTLIDPACGPGVFLAASMYAVLRRKERLEKLAEVLKPHTDPASLISRFSMNLHGVDTDSAALAIAEVSLQLIMSEGVDLGSKRIGVTLRRGDSLVSRRGFSGEKDLGSLLPDDADYAPPFEWKQEFGNVFNRKRPGFDFVLMNPPYDRVKPDFAQFLRDHLLTGNRQIQLEQYTKYTALLKRRADYFRTCGDYPMTRSHSIDLYRLFIERALSLSRDGGRMGFIVPSSLLGDTSAASLRQNLIEYNEVERVDEFREGTGLFPGVTQSVCIVSMQKGGKTRRISGAFDLSSFAGVSGRRQAISASDMTSILGPSLPIPRTNQREWAILRRIHRYRRMSSLDWLDNRRGELDLTLDQQFILESGEGGRLVRGADIGRFTLLESKHGEVVDLEAFREFRRSSMRVDDCRKRRLACQQVSNRLQRWRLKFAIVPPGQVLANSCNYLIVKDRSRHTVHSLLGVLNSTLLNWRFSLTSTNNHVSNLELGQLPLADPTTAESESLLEAIASEARGQQGKNPDTNPLLDALVFQLYGLKRTDVHLVLRRVGADSQEEAQVLGFLRSGT